MAKVFGEPPGSGASRAEQLRYVRRVSGRGLLVYGPLLLCILVGLLPTWMAVAICALLLLGIANLLGLTRKIRRAEHAERANS